MRVISRDERDAWPTKIREIASGGYCEFPDWELQENCIEYLGSEEKDSFRQCKHAVEVVKETGTHSDGTPYDTYYAVVPRIVLARNEGGCNVTSVCLDCILEAAAG